MDMPFARGGDVHLRASVALDPAKAQRVRSPA
jgi:hypothetical protein